jgi:hypothetical protein
MAYLNTLQGISSPSILMDASDLESYTVDTTPPYFAESLPCRSNRSLPNQLFPIHAEEILATFSTSNIYIGQCLLKALTLRWLRL